MQAQVFRILSRDKTSLAWPPSPSDFALVESGTIPIQKILDETTISLYCVDPYNEQALFDEVPPDVNLNETPFNHQAKYKHAIQVIKLSYDTMYHIADQIDLDDRRRILCR